MTGFKARRAVWFFLILLIALNAAVYMRHRAVTIFEAAFLLTMLGCVWFLVNAFSPRGQDTRRHPVITSIVITLMLLLNAIAFMGVYTLFAFSKTPVITLAVPVPAVQWASFDGKKRALSEWSGHAVVLHFWATWCASCKQEFPKLLAFAKAHPGIIILAVDVNDVEESAKQFIAKAGDGAGPPNVFYAFDPDSAISYDIFKIPSFPSSIVVDPKGWMRREYITPIAWDDSSIGDYLRQWQASP